MKSLLIVMLELDTDTDDMGFTMKLTQNSWTITHLHEARTNDFAVVTFLIAHYS